MADETLTLTLDSGGDVVIKLRPDLAPGHVERIVENAKEGFYDGVVFHRVIPGFMAQGGDGGNHNGTGGSSKPNLKQEFNKEPHVRGVCSMARTMDPNSANSQFFICFDDARFLDGVARVHEYLRAGDVFQVNLSRGWRAHFDAVPDPVALYAALRAANPALPADGRLMATQRLVIPGEQNFVPRADGTTGYVRPSELEVYRHAALSTATGKIDAMLRTLCAVAPTVPSSRVNSRMNLFASPVLTLPMTNASV